MQVKTPHQQFTGFQISSMLRNKLAAIRSEGARPPKMLNNRPLPTHDQRWETDKHAWRMLSSWDR